MEHTSNNDSILKIALNLAGACLISGVIIAGVYLLTADTAKKAQAQIEDKTRQELIQADSFKEIENYPKISEEPEKKEAFEALDKNGKVMGYIVYAQSKGYGGQIKMMVAVDANMKVINYKIQSHNETPGLGAKAVEPDFSKQFIGRGAGQLDSLKDITKTHEPGKIQAITGSTITSRAVTKAVGEAVQRLVDFEKVKGGK